VTRIACPFCGSRELREFEFHESLPAAGSLGEFERTYLRVADPQLSIEHWQHVGGCRAWLLVRRNPTSGAALAVELLAGDAS
jgi:sarcosine oxidase subunit delta